MHINTTNLYVYNVDICKGYLKYNDIQPDTTLFAHKTIVYDKIAANDDNQMRIYRFIELGAKSGGLGTEVPQRGLGWSPATGAFLLSKGKF